MKVKFLIIFFLISSSIFGQDREVYLNSNLNIESSSLNSGLVNEFFNGKIAIARIYNKILTEREMLQNYNALKGRFT